MAYIYCSISTGTNSNSIIYLFFVANLELAEYISLKKTS